MNCPQCNTQIPYGAPFCHHCNFSFAQTTIQSNSEHGDVKREKRYKGLLITLAVLFIFDGIVWRVVEKLAEHFDYHIYDYVKPYTFLISIVFAAIPGVVGLLLPKTSPWRLILIIAGAIWFVFRLYEWISQQFIDENPFIYFEF